MAVKKTRSKWTKEVIVREARKWAGENGYEWQPVFSRAPRNWLMDNLLRSTNRGMRSSYQGKTLLHTHFEEVFELDTKALQLLLEPKQKS